ncbi:hypothetical protein Cgig2_001021 [Carnegiea gigantea]|uniref:Uncharacterized protein n=1 Tax=Carnegiea gigantea TaxID=171969 RepID=A0A9Q1JQ37_9CARY|nr:hypothetical protein Cgig2_001021 [Carnegiea gigantea]
MDTEFQVVFRYKQWRYVGQWRDRDQNRIIELMKDAKEFFEKGQIGERCPRYFSIFLHPPDKLKQRLLVNCENQLLELCDKWQIFRRKQIHFFIIGKDNPTVIGQIVEELDGDGNVDGNRDTNGQGGVAEMADLTQGHPIDHEDSLWDDIVASIDEVQAVGELRNKFSSFPSLKVVLNIDKGESIDTVCNPIPPAIQTDRVTKTITRVDKGKEIMIDEEHIHKGKGIMFLDGGIDSDDDNFEDNSSSNYEEDGNCSVVDEDELFEHSSEDEIDRYERMYAIAQCGRQKVMEKRRIYVVHFQRNFVKAFQGPKLKALTMRACNAYNAWTHRNAMEALHKLSPFDDNTTNFVETLNDILNMVRDKPMYNLLEEISSTLTEWFCNKRKLAANWKRRVVPRNKLGMRKPRPKLKNNKGRPRKQVVTSEVGPLTSQGRESTDLGAGPSNSHPIIVTTTSTSPRRFTRQLLLQPQKSKAKKQRTGQSLSQPPLTIRDSFPNTTTPSPSQPLSSATAEHNTNARHTTIPNTFPSSFAHNKKAPQFIQP